MAAGVNRYTWDLELDPVVSFPGMILWGATTERSDGPARHLSVRLTVDGVTQTQSFACRSIRCVRSATPICSISGTSPAASATRSTRRTTR